MIELTSNKCSLPHKVKDAIKSVVGQGQVNLHEPRFDGNEKAYLMECLESTFVSSVGKYVDEFEKSLCEFTGSKYAIAVVNGTSALHIALILSGVEENDEVLIPSLSFVATANAVSYCGAVPHFIDVDEETLGISNNSLEQYLSEVSEQIDGKCINKKTGRVIRAIVPMHTFGNSVAIEGILKTANDHKINLVEDAAESLGSFYKGVHTGTFGLLGALSFNGNKIITTGGGGAILTNNKTLATKAKHITTTAKLKHQWNFKHDQVAYNYRMPNINAALGCAQLEDLPSILRNKKLLFKKYKDKFNTIENINLFQENEGTSSNYWLQTLVLDKSHAHNLDDILKLTNDSGYMTRPAWNLLHTLQPYKDCPRASLTVSKSLKKRILNIPSSTYNFK